MQDPDTLVRLATEGDHAALEQLLVRNLPALQAFVRMRVGHNLHGRENSVDLVQSVCREVLERIDEHEFRGEKAFKNWLFTAATNKIVDKHRFHHAQRRDVAREAAPPPRTEDESLDLLAQYATLGTPSMAASAREQVARIEGALDALPEQYREVLALSRLVGLSYSEIGAQIGRTETAVRGMVVRALAKLSDQLAE